MGTCCSNPEYDIQNYKIVYIELLKKVEISKRNVKCPYYK